MAGIRHDLMIGRIDADRGSRGEKHTQLTGRIEPVTRETDREYIRAVLREERARGSARGHIKAVDGAGDAQPAIGIEALDERITLMFEVAFDLPVHGIAGASARNLGATELLLKRCGRKVADVRDHAADSQA